MSGRIAGARRRALMMVVGGYVPPGVTTTWNPSDKNADIALSGGNLIATSNTLAHKAVRSVLSKAAGKWYWEIAFTSGAAGAECMVGIANSTATLNSFLGADAHGIGYFGLNGQKFYNGSGAAYGATFTTGDVLGVALDAATGYVTFYKNNASQGQVTDAVTGPYFAALSLYPNGAVMTANFGATALAYAPPAGYNAGLYA